MHEKINECVVLKEEFASVIKILLPSMVLDADNEQAMTSIYEELSRKLCNTRIQEFISATNQDLVAKKGLTSTTDINLRTTLLAHHTNLSTIRKQ